MPGPEPAKTKGKWIRLTVSVDGKQVYDSGFEDVGVFQSLPFAVDLLWAPDSGHVAYRLITAFRIVNRAGKHQTFDIIKDNSLISSFQWTGNKELLVVSKKVDDPLDMYGYPQHYHGYSTKAKNIRVLRVNLDSGITERFIGDVKDPTFMFRSIGFINQEISPTSNRVAFSDGTNLCVYDDMAGKLIRRVKIPQKSAPKPDLPPDYPPDAAKAVAALSSEPAQLEGIWWQTNDKLVAGVGLLGFPAKSFYTYVVSTNTMADVTGNLLPVWTGSDRAGNYQDSDWYRSVIK